jgi:predicted DNA-binding transcriptional regulator AlpA
MSTALEVTSVSFGSVQRAVGDKLSSRYNVASESVRARQKRQRAVADKLSRRYNVLPDNGYATRKRKVRENAAAKADVKAERTTPATPAPALLPLRTFLKQYSISKSSFYRRAAEMPPIIKIGRSVLVPVAEADAWARAKLVPAATLSQSARA